MKSTSLAFAIALTTFACKGEPPKPQPPATPAPTTAAPTTAAPTTAASPTTTPAEAPDAAAPDTAGATGPEDPPRVPDIEYVPTPQNVVDKMLEVVNITKDDVVYDLGCGDGRIVITAAQKFGARGVGFDIDPERVAESRANVKKAGVEHLVTIEQRDIFNVDLKPASVVTLYLLPELNVRLIPQLDQLKPGSRIVSHDFDMKGVEPENIWTVIAPRHRAPFDDREHYVYLWKNPLKKVPVPPDAPPADAPDAAAAPSD